MAAFAFGRKRHVHHALFPNANHCKRPRQAGEHAVHHSAAFVQHKSGLHALLLQVGNDVLCPVAKHLFIAAKGKVDVPLRDKPLFDQAFRRLHHAQQRNLCVQRAAAPQFPVKHFAAERRVLPAGLFHRHHVIMCHQHRGPGTAFPFPAEQKACGAPLALAQHRRARLVHGRVKFFQRFAERFERRFIHLCLVII